jgi:hypothetical protein
LFAGQLFSFCHAEKLAWQFQKVLILPRFHEHQT